MFGVPKSPVEDVFPRFAVSINMSAKMSATCPHGLRPGTNICLRCRYEARATHRKRRYLLMTRVAIAASGVAVAISLLIGVVIALTPDARSGSAAESEQAGNVALAAPRPSTASPSPHADSAAASSPGTVAPVLKLEPDVAEGRRELADGMVVVREGGQVTVHFDTETLRTRHDWKFERVVRSTLPLVFGSVVRAALDSIPVGHLAAGGDLLTELPTRGIEVAIGGGQTLRVWPVTRPGQSGPLVVAYRASSTP
jgi:hypothetical protein